MKKRKLSRILTSFVCLSTVTLGFVAFTPSTKADAHRHHRPGWGGYGYGGYGYGWGGYGYGWGGYGGWGYWR